MAEEKQRREQLIARLGAGSDETTELGGNAVSGKENEGGDVDDEEDAEDDDDDDDEEEEEDDDDEEEEEEEEESGQGTVEGGDTPGMRRPRLGSSAVTAHEEEVKGRIPSGGQGRRLRIGVLVALLSICCRYGLSVYARCCIRSLSLKSLRSRTPASQ